MRLETSTTRSFRFGLAAIAALTFSIVLAVGNTSRARAQDDASGDGNAPSAADQSDQNGADDPDQKAQPDAAQQAHDAADAAQDALDSATQARDQLESDGASQDQIDAANRGRAGESRETRRRRFGSRCGPRYEPVRNRLLSSVCDGCLSSDPSYQRDVRLRFKKMQCTARFPATGCVHSWQALL